MLREKVRERCSENLEQEVRRFEISRTDVRNDFRESLFLVFVDNLSPKVEQIYLWELFKPVGRVRDVYLSSSRSARRGKFAFVRFESWAEADKVAKLMDGKCVYGWPIVSKVAMYGWSKRRTAGSSSLRMKIPGDEGFHVSRRVREHHGRNLDRWSYAGVVKGNGKCKVERTVERIEERIKQVERLVLEGSRFNKDWLERSAIGVLKNFASIAKVNQRLSNRGFHFSSTYLGGKSIMWSFESKFDCENFIENRFFWDEFFCSMMKWSDSFVLQSRLAWINVRGIPLQCWDEALFNRLGRVLGEPVVVEEDTLRRKRLDRGRLLVLLPVDRLCPDMIAVVVGNRSFIVNVREEESLVELSWVSKILGLEMESFGVSDKVLPEKATNGGGPKERVGVASSSCNVQVASDKVNVGVRGQQQISDAYRDSYERAVVSDSPTPLNLNFEYLGEADCKDIASKSRESVSNSDNNQGVLGQDRKLKGEGPSVEKCRDAKAVLSAPSGLFQADRTESIFGSEVALGKSSGRKSSVLRRSHNMILRSSKACEKTKKLNPKLINKVAWNLEDEVVKVLEKGMALGLNFNGRKKELLEIIAGRGDVNDNRFQDLVRRLVLIHKASE